MQMSEAVILGLGVWGFCINPAGLRPVYVRFMHPWAGITGVGGDFVHESYLSRSCMGKRAWGRPFLLWPPRRPVEEGRQGVGLSRFRFWFKILGPSHHIPDFCTKSRFLLYSVYVLIFTCQWYCLLFRSVSLYLYTKTLIEWETGSPSRTRFFGDQFRRSRDRVFIVQDGDFGLKNGL
jgi:hypothetical protein